MTFTCQNCQSITTIEFEFDYQKFACSSCNCVHTKSNNSFSPNKNINSFNYETKFFIGQKANFDSEEYEIISILVKQVYTNYQWIEYVLATITDKYVYLSEFQGHFVLLREIDYSKSVLKNPLFANYENKTYRLYEYSNPQVLGAHGFFDYDYTRPYKLNEYIKGTHLLSFELIGSEQKAYYGEHISHNAIQKIFSIKELPAKIGVGLVQPFFINLKNLALIFCATAILILVSVLIIDNGRADKEVLNTTLEYSKYSNKTFRSPSFTLVGSSAPLTINLYSEIHNSWANASVGLINEKTNEEVYATKDMEYYYGSEGGEGWKEGDQSESFNICGVSAGTYHLMIAPSKAAEDLNENSLEIKAKWSKPSLWNFGMVGIFMSAILLVVYLLRYNFEKRRWQDSDNSIYNTEE